MTQMIYVDTRANLPDDLLMVGDKTSMANSLEARVPFLDYRLVEFAESLPPRFKLRGLQRKYLHKKAMEKWLPQEVVYRKKKGFANPVDSGFASRCSGSWQIACSTPTPPCTDTLTRNTSARSSRTTRPAARTI